MWRKVKHFLLAGWFLAAIGANVALLDVTKTGTSPKLSVVSAANTPAGATIGGVGMEVFRFTLAAKDADFSVQKITFYKSGTCSSLGTGGVSLVEATNPINVYASLPAGTAWFALTSFYFQNFSAPLIIPSGTTKTLALRGDTTGCRGTVRFTIPSIGVTAQYLYPATAYAGNIYGGTLQFPTPPVATSGTLTVGLDGDTPLSTLVVGGATGVNVAKFKFSSTGESFTISKLRVAVNGSSVCYGSSATATTQTKNRGSCDDGILALKLSYPKADGTTGTSICSLSAGVADCNGLAFYVDVNKPSSILTVSVDTSAISQSYVSGDAPVYGLDLDQNFLATGKNSYKALTSCVVVTAGTGLACGSGTAYDGMNKTDVNANAFVLHKTKPTVTLASGSPSGADVPKINQEVLRFSVAADAAADLEVAQLYFKLNLTDQGNTDWNTNAKMLGNGTTTSKLQLYDRMDMTSVLPGTWTLYSSSGTTTGSSDAAYVKFTFNTAKSIAAGVSNTFTLIMDTTNAARSTASMTGDKIQVGIPAVMFVGGTLGTAQGITWNETGNGAYFDATAGANIYGTYIKNLPVTGGTIVY